MEKNSTCIVKDARVLNDHFQSVFTSENLSSIPSYHSNIPSMPSISISTGEIEALLNKLDTNKSAGPDQISSYIFLNIVLMKLVQFFKSST